MSFWSFPSVTQVDVSQVTCREWFQVILKIFENEAFLESALYGLFYFNSNTEMISVREWVFCNPNTNIIRITP